MYLTSFVLPIESEKELLSALAGTYYDDSFNPYPCGIFPAKGLSEIFFSPITIFYGGNGSGKSTLLNLIAEKLELNRIAPFNSSELFSMYLRDCQYSMAYDDEGFLKRIPNGSRIITSDDIFDYMLTIRASSEEISEGRANAIDKWADLRFGRTIRLTGLEDYEALRLQVLARRKSLTRREFVKRTVGAEVRLQSNGETAFHYFDARLKNDTLYCLDEPENSMSPQMQLKLVELLENMAHYCGCQFVIATHSPFLLALSGARIYDLDTSPVVIKNWWELENTKTFYAFFKKHSHLFEREDDL